LKGIALCNTAGAETRPPDQGALFIHCYQNFAARFSRIADIPSANSALA
jgi:hypothetical protein